jgi:hypothetical protein
MPSKKDKRAKGVEMTEQQPKILQIIDIVHTPPTADIVQMPESTDTRHLADGSPDGRHSAAQTSPGRKPILGVYRMERIQESRLTILERWHSPYESLHLDQWKALCNMSDVINDLPTRVIEKEPVDWRYHIGDDVFVTIKAPFPFVHIRKRFIPAGEWTYRPTKRGVALHFGEWKELKQIIPLLAEREPELRQLVPLYRTDL